MSKVKINLETEDSNYEFIMEIFPGDEWEPLIEIKDVENNESVRIYPSEVDQIVDILHRLRVLANSTPEDM